MDISENPVLNVLICSIPILMMIGIAAFQGSWLRFWYLKRWHLLDRQVQSKIVHRNTNVFLAGWVLSLPPFWSGNLPAGIISGQCADPDRRGNCAFGRFFNY